MRQHPPGLALLGQQQPQPLDGQPAEMAGEQGRHGVYLFLALPQLQVLRFQQRVQVEAVVLLQPGADFSPLPGRYRAHPGLLERPVGRGFCFRSHRGGLDQQRGEETGRAEAVRPQPGGALHAGVEGSLSVGGKRRGGDRQPGGQVHNFDGARVGLQ